MKDRPRSQGTMWVLKDGCLLLRGLFALILVMKRKCSLFKRRSVFADVVSEHFLVTLFPAVNERTTTAM